MGTYLLRADAVSTKTASAGAWTALPSLSTANADLVAAIFDQSNLNSILINGGGVSYTGQIRFNPKYYLDGAGVPTEINSLPAGFNLTTALAAMDLGVVGGAASASVQSFLQFDITRESAAFTSSGVKTFAYPSSLPGAISLYASGFGVRNSDTVLNPHHRYYYLQIQGDYSIISGSFTIPTAQPVSVGDTITINGTSGLNNVTSVRLFYTDPTTGVLTEVTVNAASFVTQSATQITFLLPVAFNGLSLTASVYLLSSAFSGYTFVAPLSILVADASGIYKIVTDKTSDTIYTSHTTGATSEVKIPNPFIKTGFFGG